MTRIAHPQTLHTSQALILFARAETLVFLQNGYMETYVPTGLVFRGGAFREVSRPWGWGFHEWDLCPHLERAQRVGFLCLSPCERTREDDCLLTRLQVHVQ